MENSISDLLSNYCDQLIGVAPEDKIKKKKKKEKISNSISNKNENDVSGEGESKLCNSKEVEIVKKIPKTDENSNVNSSFLEHKKSKKKKKSKTKALSKSETDKDTHVVNGNKVTNDGFKVITDIPPDDSDISDAFESDLEEDLEKKPSSIKVGKNKKDGNKITDDGFKVRYEDELPQDDSDISDAFSEGEDEEIQGEGNKMTEDGFKIQYEDDLQADDSDISDAFSDDDEDFVGNDKEMQYSNSKGIPDRSRKVNKLLQGMIDDFDLDEKSLKVKKTVTEKKVVQGSTQKTKASKLTLAAKQNLSSEVTVIDYATKRGGGNKKKEIVEKEIPKEDKDTNKKELSDDAIEKQFKRARFEVFKFGMGGFNKEKKQDARVALAIKLGAKPPKKKAVNYKDLQVQKKDQQIQKAEDRESKRRMGLQVKKPAGKKRVRDTNKVGDFDTQVGKFDGGTVRLSKSDIDKIKRKK